MKEVNLSQWERREIYEYMSKLSFPFYSVTFRLDVTELYEYTHERGISFYYSLIYLVTEALNQIPEFRMTIVGGKPYELERRSPSFCDLKKGSEAFRIIDVPFKDWTLEEFCKEAKEISVHQTSLFASDPANEKNEGWIFFSCLPWVDLTGLTNERDLDPDDSSPRISWGKYVQEGEKKILGFSVEVNHRLVDGIHIGRLAEKISEEIRNLK